MARKDTTFLNNLILNFNGTIHEFGGPVIVGIVNLTPDSFYDGGKLNSTREVIERVEMMIGEGAQIIDVGAYSSRPGADEISVEEEGKRLRQPLKSIRKHFPEIIISVDTFRSGIAEEALDLGANMINDISGGLLDGEMMKTVAKYRVPYVLMHMKGTPATMQNDPKYSDVVGEIYRYFQDGIDRATEAGITDLILDPGFGFGKSLADNFAILRNTSEFDALNFPLMAGVSRKSMINKVLDIKASEALNGTTVLHTILLLKGIKFLRVHDVRAAIEAIKIVSYYQNL